MRDIKFRGIDKETKKMVYGYYVNGMIIDIKNDRTYEVDQKTVGQYLGLKDKNGIEVYEGDLTALLDGRKIRNIVAWDEEKASFCLLDINKKYYSGLYLNGYGYCPYTVHGNIYENKELLKKVRSKENGEF